MLFVHSKICYKYTVNKIGKLKSVLKSILLVCSYVK